MKNQFIIPAALILVLSLGSCKNSNTEEPNVSDTDTLTEEAGTSIDAETDILNDLLGIKDEAELKEIFGAENVSWDTIQGAEGETFMGTYLFKGTDDEATVFWENDVKKERLSAVSIEIKFDEIDYNKYNCNTRWKTSEGFSLCSKLEDIVKYNEKPLTFYGFGWDFSGLVISYNNGKLENSGISLSLGISPEINESENYPTDFIGDQEFSSDHPAAKNTPIIVFRITVHKVEIN